MSHNTITPALTTEPRYRASVLTPVGRRVIGRCRDYDRAFSVIRTFWYINSISPVRINPCPSIIEEKHDDGWHLLATVEGTTDDRVVTYENLITRTETEV